MFNLSKYSLVLFLFIISTVNAFELASEHVFIEEVLPLFNVHEKKSYVAPDEKGINPTSIVIPDAVRLGTINHGLSVEGFIGETVFKDIIIKTGKKTLDVKIDIQDINNKEIKITPRIVTIWYQSGFSTIKKKHAGQLTYELLLSDDHDVVINDRWIKSPDGGWIYEPPEIMLSDTLKTTLRPDSHKRVLLKISLSKSVLPGQYTASIKISTMHDGIRRFLIVPLTINVKPVNLSDEAQSKYKLLLYTAFKLNDHIERPRAYVNAMRLHGTEKERDRLFLSYLTDIQEHGFNGITIHDWDSVNLEKTLKMTDQLGIRYIVLHAKTPINKKYKNNGMSIVSGKVKEIYNKYHTELYYYGYDEHGGNKSLNKQLKLNEDIHAVGGKSVNAVFWDDIGNVIKTTNKQSQCFDILAYSMGSHGHKEMFKSLPYKGKNDFCSKQGTEYLTYWHPHVENPVINRIFTGFWLWASGFDGVIPHGYYFPSHIEKFLSKEDLKYGVSNVTSPYDDWAFWMPGKLQFRHHNSVYPSKDGPIGTLQWEGVLSGYMDLKYIVTLEKKLENPNINKSYKDKIIALLDEIRSDVLQISSPIMSDKKSITYLKKLEYWKKEISNLLLN